MGGRWSQGRREEGCWVMWLGWKEVRSDLPKLVWEQVLQLGQGGCPVDRAVIVGDFQGSPVLGGLVVGGADVHWLV